MPIDKGNDSGGSGDSGTIGRKGRPPWVKEGPNPLPAPPMPWTLNKRNSMKDISDDASKLVVPKLRKVVKQEPQQNGKEKKETFIKPQLKPIPQKEAAPEQKEQKISIPKLNSVKDRELPPKRNSVTGELIDDIDKAMPATRNALVKQESMRRVSVPNAPPMPPPCPAMPGLVETNMSDQQKEKLNMLRQRPKHRPDWTEMLKDLEKGRQLKHVECNDRSKPLIPKAKAKGQFIFESEKQNDPHHDLLNQIQQGIKLKQVKTNDRSKPILDGLRKFRRQMTIEEQIQKSQSMASIPPEELPDESDEMDDIDKVRDDLQSTKQLLAFEMRNKEAQIRENKKLMARIQQLEAELEKQKLEGPAGKEASGSASEADQKLITSLKQQADVAKKTSEELEKKYAKAADDLDTKKTELEEQKRQNRELEKRVQELLAGKRQSIIQQPQEDEDEFAMSESESDGEDTEEKRERRAKREVKMFTNKLKSCKNKEDNAKKERIALKEQVKTHQKAIKDEKKKYKALQKEVDKMANLMKESSEDEDDSDEDEEDEEEKPETESESESDSDSSDSESSDSETDSEASHSEPEDAPLDKIKANLTHRVKRHENMLAALKKGNLMLKANVERLQDDLNKQKELTMGLQEDLDSVLAELG